MIGKKVSIQNIIKFCATNGKYTDFLKYIAIGEYFENEKYYYYKTKFFLITEIRLHKKSFRVSTSLKFTK